MNSQKYSQLANINEISDQDDQKVNRSEKCARSPSPEEIPNAKKKTFDDLFPLNLFDFEPKELEIEKKRKQRGRNSKSSRKNYCQLEQFQLSDSDQIYGGDDNWQDDQTKKKNNNKDRRKLIQLTRYVYQYLIKYSQGNYSQIFEECISSLKDCKESNKKKNFQRRFYEAINGMESVGILKKDKSKKTISLSNFTFIEQLRKDQEIKQSLDRQILEREQSIQLKKIVRRKFRAACATYVEFNERNKKRHEKVMREQKKIITLPITSLHSESNIEERLQATQDKVAIFCEKKDFTVDSEIFLLSHLFPQSDYSKQLRDQRKSSKKKV